MNSVKQKPLSVQDIRHMPQTVNDCTDVTVLCNIYSHMDRQPTLAIIFHCIFFMNSFIFIYLIIYSPFNKQFISTPF